MASYGTFNINDGVNYFLVKKDSPGFTPVAQTYFKVGRLEGMKKTGETVNQKTINCDIVIVGSSRADLEAKIDSLYAALNQRGQNLVLHTNDNRYHIADCIEVDLTMDLGNILHCKATCIFNALQPYLYSATTSTLDTGSMTLTLVSGSTYTFGTQTTTGGGNVFSRPTLRIYQRAVASASWTQIQVQQTTDNQTITMASSLPSVQNDYIDIICDPNGSNGFTVLKNSSTVLAFTGIFPVLEPGTTNWTVTINAPTAPTAQAVWTWTPRWLS